MRRIGVVLVALAGSLGSARLTRAQEMETPVALQMELFTKVMTFDRNAVVAPRATPVVIAVVYQSGNRISRAAHDEAVAALATATSGERRVTTVSLDLDHESLDARLATAQPQAMYIAPLRAVSIAAIASRARVGRIRSFTGVPSYVKQGVAVSVRIRGERPRLVVNLPAARAEGADYMANLLQMAEVLQ